MNITLTAELEKFLDCMAHDLTSHPDGVHRVDPALIDRIQALVGQVEVDLDAPLSPGDE